jgi:hypothetical protein
VTIWLPVSLASALLLQAAAPTSGSRPTFSGTWKLDAARSESAASSESAEPLIVEITQTDQELTVATTQGERHNRTVHGFVASPAAPFSIDGTAGRAYWDGLALVTEGTRLVQGQTVATRETRRLNADQSEMTVDVVVIVQHGYSVRGAKNYGVGRDVYTRVAR